MRYTTQPAPCSAFVREDEQCGEPSTHLVRIADDWAYHFCDAHLAEAAQWETALREAFDVTGDIVQALGLLRIVTHHDPEQRWG